MLLVILALILAFAVLLPFASKTPDGLEILTEDSASQKPVWNGLIADYSIALGDQYVSTLVAGLIGLGIVFAATFCLGATLTQKKKAPMTQKS